MRRRGSLCRAWWRGVGDGVITAQEFQRDLEYRINLARRTERNKVVPDAAFRRRTLDELIDGRVLRILAQNAGIAVSEEEVQAEFDRGFQALPAGSDALQKYLKREGLTLDGLMAEIRARLLVQKFIAEKTKDVTASEEEMKAQYARWDADGWTARLSKTVDFQHILAQVMPEDPQGAEVAQKRLEAARARILAGESFAAVAREITDDRNSKEQGGAYYEAAKGSLPKEFEQHLWNDPLGELSEPFASEAGWHLLQVIARNEPGKMPFESLQEQLRDKILSDKKKAILDRLVAEAKHVIHVEIVKAAGAADTPPAMEGGTPNVQQ